MFWYLLGAAVVILSCLVIHWSHRYDKDSADLERPNIAAMNQEFNRLRKLESKK